MVKAGAIPPPVEAVLFKSMGFPDVVEDSMMDFRVGLLKAEAFKDAAGGDVQVEAVEYTQDMLKFNSPLGFHCREDQIINGKMKKEDMILDDSYEMVARQWANELTKTFVLEE
eukprot:CAMPEP_0195148068 /NCGR_PEP_ID=MMETSP0448-20130528/174557_1 /TAXON_ID=66468 /ORGANISM="Heterocapsa triquestra, Strain CCMP 448" /LENGTH=112 /DNA_ID=CAMNT_0040186673 /DNA_START=15 /DNA_END=350 /DNA_ORIENTATION=+